LPVHFLREIALLKKDMKGQGKRGRKSDMRDEGKGDERIKSLGSVEGGLTSESETGIGPH